MGRKDAVIVPKGLSHVPGRKHLPQILSLPQQFHKIRIPTVTAILLVRK